MNPGFTRRYWIDQPQGAIVGRVATAMAPRGYQIESQGEGMAQFKKPGLRATTVIIFLLIPVIGWALLILAFLTNKGAFHITIYFGEQDGRGWVNVAADDAELEPVFGSLEPVENDERPPAEAEGR